VRFGARRRKLAFEINSRVDLFAVLLSRFRVAVP
jgi:hypothetical protein